MTGVSASAFFLPGLDEMGDFDPSEKKGSTVLFFFSADCSVGTYATLPLSDKFEFFGCDIKFPTMISTDSSRIDRSSKLLRSLGTPLGKQPEDSHHASDHSHPLRRSIPIAVRYPIEFEFFNSIRLSRPTFKFDCLPHFIIHNITIAAFKLSSFFTLLYHLHFSLNVHGNTICLMNG